MLSMVHSDSAMPIPKPAEKHPRARGWRRCAGTPGRIADFMRSSDRTSAPLAYVLDHHRRATMAQFSRDREPCLPIRLPGDPPRVVPRRTARGRGARAARGIRVFFENTIRAETEVQRPKPLRIAPAKTGLVIEPPRNEWSARPQASRCAASARGRIRHTSRADNKADGRLWARPAGGRRNAPRGVATA